MNSIHAIIAAYRALCASEPRGPTGEESLRVADAERELEELEESAHSAWNAAIEAAAKACLDRHAHASREADAFQWGMDGHEKHEGATKAWRQAEMEAGFCVDRIRALKREAK